MTSPRWQETDIPINGFQTPAYRAGHGKSIPVMAHGFTNEALCRTNRAATLMDDFEIILYDESGHEKPSGHSRLLTHREQSGLYSETMPSFLNPYQ